MDKRYVYADNAATTKLNPKVLEDMMPYLTQVYGNPSSLYQIGAQSKKVIEDARVKVAQLIGAPSRTDHFGNVSNSNIYFTSGGSEADNWAIFSVAQTRKNKGKHIITSKIEHHAVLHTLNRLEKEGYEVTYLDVYEDGLVRVEDVEKAIREDTILITIMYANNEIGTIQPIKQIGELAKKHSIVFHTDAVQAVGHLPINVADENIDMLSMAAHKFGGPKGMGALYVRNGLQLTNLIYGGGQERTKRAGTENIAGIVGMASALQYSLENLEEKNKALAKKRDRLIENLLKIPYTRLNGHALKRLFGNVNVSIEFIEGEALILMLDAFGISASSGSACTSGSLDPSHVLLALGLRHEVAHGSLRLTINEDTSDEDIDYIIECVPKVAEKLRAMSPTWNN